MNEAVTVPSPHDYKWKLDEDKEWHEFVLKRMFESYGEGDTIYDKEAIG